jgi:predicted naringenin-chalcone synthase
MSAQILGMGEALPAVSIAQHAAADMVKAFGRFSGKQERLVEVLYRRARIKTRASVLLEPGNGHGPEQAFFPQARDRDDRGPTTLKRLKRYAQEAPKLAAAAAARALDDAALAPDRITHLVTVSCTGFMAPGVDIRMIKMLHLAQETQRANIGFMGCHGALNGLRAACAFAENDPKARVLLCAVELCSLHFRYGWNEDGLVANSLFSDGAAACVLGRALPRSKRLVVAGTGSVVLPDSEEAMSWRIGNHGFEMRLDSSVPALIRRHLRPWLERWLKARGLSIASVGSWAVHPGGPRILSSVLSGLNLPDSALSASRAVLAQHGNMSSPTVLFILDRLRLAQAPRPYVALAFGPGLAAEVALFC